MTVSVARGQITPSNGPEISIAATATFQTAPAVAPDGSGGVIIAWQKARADGWDIFARHLRAFGTQDIDLLEDEEVDLGGGRTPRAQSEQQKECRLALLC